MKMRLLAGGLFAASLFVGTGAAQAACTPTGFMRDSINLTAAKIGGNLRDTTLDATGCDIGVYYGPGMTASLSNAEVSGARYFGVVNNGGKVAVVNSRIKKIGDDPRTGSLHGNGYLCASDSGQPSTGRIIASTFSEYQKNGIVLEGPQCDGYNVVFNYMVGDGPTARIAQNGIVVKGASKVILGRNTAIGHSFTGPSAAASAGINVLGGDCFSMPLVKDATISQNNLVGNDVGMYLLNMDSSCLNAPSTPTANQVKSNVIFQNAITNTTGNGTGPYQFGLSITVTGDLVSDNSICGGGYNPAWQLAGGMIGGIDAAGSGSFTQTDNKCKGLQRVRVGAQQPSTPASILQGRNRVKAKHASAN